MPKITQMELVRLKFNGEATKGSTSIGLWRDDWRAGKSIFCGRLHSSRDWSPWMKKSELRQWFSDQIEKEKA